MTTSSVSSSNSSTATTSTTATSSTTGSGASVGAALITSLGLGTGINMTTLAGQMASASYADNLNNLNNQKILQPLVQPNQKLQILSQKVQK